MIKIVTIVSISCSVSLIAFAQEYPKKDIDLSILADEIFGFQDQDLNYQELYENMALLLANPINLNKANAEELRFLNILSEYQVQSLLKYREENGLFLSVYELQSIPGFDLSTIYRIISFVKVEDSNKTRSFLRRVFAEENNYLVVRYDKTLEQKKGFKQSASPSYRFKGNSDDLYIRFRTNSTGDFSFGFTLEKDAGEAFTWNTNNHQNGFDYLSFHAQLMNKGNLKNLIIGDFQTQFGQGLILGGSFGFGKGSETVTTVRRSNLGFMPYTSVNEAGYKRGIAFTYQLHPNIYLSPFYSSAWRDANLTNDSTQNSFVTSFQTTGYHRNEIELNNRLQLLERNYGAVISFRKSAIDAGFIFNAIEYNQPINRNPQPYNQFTFSGNSIYNTGGYLNYTLHNFTFFSEAAKTINEGIGVSAGLLGSITPKLDIALHYRNFQRNFYSQYSNAFSENSTPQNEMGFYWGLKYRWNRKVSGSAYTDLFKFPWLRFRSYSPSEGYEWLIRLNYQPAKNILFFIQAREESKVRNISDEQSNLYLTSEGLKRNYWVNCDYGATNFIKLKTRAQFSSYQIGGATTKGVAIIQDVSIDFSKVSFTTRYALFDTENYDNRQYVFERDVWLAYTLPAYSGKGIRSYALMQYSFNKYLTFWLRYSRIRYTDRDRIGSGADEIMSNVKNDFRFQIRIRL